jgi:hypothetical protein
MSFSLAFVNALQAYAPFGYFSALAAQLDVLNIKDFPHPYLHAARTSISLA